MYVYLCLFDSTVLHTCSVVHTTSFLVHRGLCDAQHQTRPREPIFSQGGRFLCAVRNPRTLTLHTYITRATWSRFLSVWVRGKINRRKTLDTPRTKLTPSGNHQMATSRSTVGRSSKAESLATLRRLDPIRKRRRSHHRCLSELIWHGKSLERCIVNRQRHGC